MRRLVDILASGVASCVCLPLWLIAGIFIKLESRGPVFYRATRVGRNGETFELFKLRTMRASTAVDGPRVTQAGDPRITRFGRVLRKVKLDETPQFINVLAGDMALVGPRPEDPLYVSRYTSSQREILQYTPGLISPAVLAYRHEEAILAGALDVEETYEQEILPHKLILDLEYMRRRSMSSDLRLIAQTVRAVVRVKPDAATQPDKNGN